MEQIEKLDEALWSIRFAQSWLKSEADRHAISINYNSLTSNKIGKNAVL